MDYIFEISGLVLCLLGIAGSFIPVIPGPITSWFGIFILQQSQRIQIDQSLLYFFLLIAAVIFLLDYLIPALSTKKFGGSKKGIAGATLGLVVGLFLGPIGLLLGPFMGAYFGERLHGSNNKVALKAAWGSFLGLITGFILKFVIAFLLCSYAFFLYVSQVIF